MLGDQILHFLEYFYYLLNNDFTIFLPLKNSDFQNILINSKKYFKKYKIWSPITLQYEDHVEKFGSIVWTLKIEIWAGK